MRFLYRKRFLKDLARVPSKIRLQIESFVFDDLPVLESITKNSKIEKMRGYQSCYKIRFGAYRVGLRVEDDKVILERVLHRRDIYRYFP